MNKAFIFDMDGVLVNSEPYWVKYEGEFFRQIFGTGIAEKIGHAPGRGTAKVYELAQEYGAKVDRKKYMRGFDEVAMRVYDEAPITKGLDALANVLIARRFKIGVVTQSPPMWIDRVIPRLRFRDKISAIVSIAASPRLKPKPAPDGFLKAFRNLRADPAQSIILEDSNPGIEAAKASGAFTVGYRGNLLSGYEQDGAHAYAFTMSDVVALINRTTLR